MSLKLKNRWNLVRDDWWEWEAFIDDEGSGELNNVVSVKYVLHPTFVDPVRVVDNPVGGFRLKTEGRGEFDLVAYVQMKNEQPQKLTHEIELKYDPPVGVSGSSPSTA
ncbi:MAG TPA: pYEATS domain-containing protein [Pyrinomonadaceae bacterium]|jgi:transcription initiation factor IIF auxiliary subunit